MFGLLEFYFGKYAQWVNILLFNYAFILIVPINIGAFPYSLLTEKELLCQLKRGHRLEQPQNCSYEMLVIIIYQYHGFVF